MIVARDISVVTTGDFEFVEERVTEIRKMLYALIARVTRSPTPRSGRSSQLPAPKLPTNASPLQFSPVTHAADNFRAFELVAPSWPSGQAPSSPLRSSSDVALRATMPRHGMGAALSVSSGSALS